MTDVLLFGAFPYISVVLLLVISIQRYRNNAFTISSLSSQFLETRKLFWGSLPFHLGILLLFVGHLIGFLVPRSVIAFSATPLRLIILEVTGLTAGLLFAWGLVLLMVRRFTSKRLRPVTTVVDYVVYAMLVFQSVTGLYVSLYLRWGSAWYVHVVVPYLWSLFAMKPQIELMASVPWMARLHVLGAFLLFSVFAFTRLMHVLVAPVPYLWRRTQLVVWNRRRGRGAEG